MDPDIHMIKWGVYHRDREYARERDDELLAVVYAATKEQAEAEASMLALDAPSGIWCWPYRRPGSSSSMPAGDL